MSQLGRTWPSKFNFLIQVAILIQCLTSVGGKVQPPVGSRPFSVAMAFGMLR